MRGRSEGTGQVGGTTSQRDIGDEETVTKSRLWKILNPFLDNLNLTVAAVVLLSISLIIVTLILLNLRADRDAFQKDLSRQTGRVSTLEGQIRGLGGEPIPPEVVVQVPSQESPNITIVVPSTNTTERSTTTTTRPTSSTIATPPPSSTSTTSTSTTQPPTTTTTSPRTCVGPVCIQRN